MLRAAELGQDAASGLRVSKADHQVLSATARSLVNQSDLLGCQLIESFTSVGNGKCDMMDAFTFVLYELGDSALFASRLQELNFGLSHLEEGGSYLLVSHLFDIVAFETQNVLVIRDSRFQTLNGDSNVFDVSNIHNIKNLRLISIFILQEAGVMFDQMDGDQQYGSHGEHPQRWAQPSMQGDAGDDVLVHQAEQQVIDKSIGEDCRIDRHILSAHEGLPGECHRTFLAVAQAGQEGGHTGRPLLELLGEPAAEEGLLSEHDAFIVEPVNERNDQESPDIHREDEDAGPYQIVGKVERMAHHRIDPLGVELVGHLRLRIAAGSAFRRGADRIGAQDESRERNQHGYDADCDVPAIVMPQPDLMIPSLVGAADDRQGDQEDNHRNLTSIFEEKVASMFEFLYECHRVFLRLQK